MGVRARPMAWWELASVSRADRITEGAAKATGARRVYAETCISARASMASGDLSSAITALEPISAESPSAIDAHRLLGIALLESGEAARARRPFEVALEGDPFDLVAQIGLAEVEEATEGPAVAFRAWRRAWELEPGFEPVSSRLREIRRVQVAEGTATLPFTTDGTIDGPVAHTHSSLARARLRAGLHHHAILDTMEALRHDRSRVDVQLLLAEAWWRAGESEVAHDVAASILESAPNCVAANLLVAVHRRSVSRDPRLQVERARQADPFDRIAHQLFAGRDVPPIMDDAWSGDQWSASRATYGEWPVVAVMPRAVAVVRAQLAAEKAAAEAAERARIEAEAEARRRKAAEEAAKKPAAGAFKGTGVISDAPPKPAGGKSDDAGAAPPKPAGFKGSGVIADDEPTFKSKSRRPPGADPASIPPPSSTGEPSHSAEPSGLPANPQSDGRSDAVTSPPDVREAPAAELKPASKPSDADQHADESPSSGPSATSEPAPAQEPPRADAETAGTARMDSQGSAADPTVRSTEPPVGSAIEDHEEGPPRVESGVADGAAAPIGDVRSSPPSGAAQSRPATIVTVSRLIDTPTGQVGSIDAELLRATADAAFRDRRFTAAVRAYAALLRLK